MDLTSDGFGEAFRQAREAKHLTQEDAARLLDVTTSTIRNWEHGRHEPRHAEFRRVCLLFGWTPPWSSDRATGSYAGRLERPTPERTYDVAFA